MVVTVISLSRTRCDKCCLCSLAVSALSLPYFIEFLCFHKESIYSHDAIIRFFAQSKESASVVPFL
jgi:hypothetical protein